MGPSCQAPAGSLTPVFQLFAGALLLLAAVTHPNLFLSFLSPRILVTFSEPALAPVRGDAGVSRRLRESFISFSCTIV